MASPRHGAHGLELRTLALTTHLAGERKFHGEIRFRIILQRHARLDHQPFRKSVYLSDGFGGQYHAGERGFIRLTRDWTEWGNLPERNDGHHLYAA